MCLLHSFIVVFSLFSCIVSLLPFTVNKDEYIIELRLHTVSSPATSIAPSLSGPVSGDRSARLLLGVDQLVRLSSMRPPVVHGPPPPPPPPVGRSVGLLDRRQVAVSIRCRALSARTVGSRRPPWEGVGRRVGRLCVGRAPGGRLALTETHPPQGGVDLNVSASVSAVACPGCRGRPLTGRNQRRFKRILSLRKNSRLNVFLTYFEFLFVR